MLSSKVKPPSVHPLIGRQIGQEEPSQVLRLGTGLSAARVRCYACSAGWLRTGGGEVHCPGCGELWEESDFYATVAVRKLLGLRGADLAVCPSHGPWNTTALWRGTGWLLSCVGQDASEVCDFEQPIRLRTPLHGVSDQGGKVNETKAVILRVLADAEGGFIVAQIVARTGLSRGAVDGALRRYQRGGWAERSEERVNLIPNGRAYLWTLAERGKRWLAWWDRTHPAGK